MCVNSLKLASDFKNHNNLERVKFYQMNLFMPIFKDESFHMVISNGVLHHTSDPYGGFVSLSKLVKKGGYILIGLYNTYGRLITDFRRLVFNASHNRFKYLDPQLRRKDTNEAKKNSWFNDQYKNPHESKHTIGEVMNWFDNNNFEFVNGIPKVNYFEPFKMDEKLFKVNSRGNALHHCMVQSELFFRGNSEGGFFIMIGRKR